MIESDAECVKHSQLLYNNIYVSGSKIKNIYLSNGSVINSEYNDDLIDGVCMRNTNLMEWLIEKVPTKVLSSVGIWLVML